MKKILILFLLTVFVNKGFAEDKGLKILRSLIENVEKTCPPPSNVISLAGGLTNTPNIWVFVLIHDWENLPKKEKSLVIEKMPLIVEYAKANPDKVITIPKHAPVYPMFLRKLKNLGRKDWCIVGLLPKSGRCLVEKSLVCGK